MRALVIYESMYGHTKTIAEAIGGGLWGTGAQVRTARVAEVRPDDLRRLDLLVLGAPTHGSGLSRRATRRAAEHAARKWGSGLRIQPGATGAGMREWLSRADFQGLRVACFDTRLPSPRATGSAAHAMARRARTSGGILVAPPKGFALMRSNCLVEGEAQRARKWATELADALVRDDQSRTAGVGRHPG